MKVVWQGDREHMDRFVPINWLHFTKPAEQFYALFHHLVAHGLESALVHQMDHAQGIGMDGGGDSLSKERGWKRAGRQVG